MSRTGGWRQLSRANEQLTFFEPDNQEYEQFVAKFKPKLTTDDCFTPPAVFDAVKCWVSQQYGVTDEQIVRPFWPGGDYEAFSYPAGCVVLDTPPFSILAKIQEFYLQRSIHFFLFAPGLTLLGTRKSLVMRVNHIAADAEIIYQNGAKVRTGFVTNLGGDIILQSAPDLHRMIAAAQKTGSNRKPSYCYPPHVTTSARVQRFSKNGIEFSVAAHECTVLKTMDVQRAYGKVIFGGGLLLSDDAAQRLILAEKAADNRAAEEAAGALYWPLSDRERGLVEELNAKSKKNPAAGEPQTAGI